MPSDLDRLAMASAAKADAATAARAIPLLDLTSLGDADDEAGARALACRGREAGVAALCLWPRFVGVAHESLAGSSVRVATVANFPAGGDDIGAAADEVRLAFEAGADEVDVVAPLQAILDGDVSLVGELVELCNQAKPHGGTLKIILETGVLQAPDVITAAARAAVMAGVDMLKTSTGKVPVGATLEAAATLLEVVAEAEGRVGLKLSGGVRAADQAAGYLALADARMGEHWVSPGTFRIGASSLLDDLQARL
ncbi:MAG: deoxyribose-phosphate aldolase [Pseudomonadota bacterium]